MKNKANNKNLVSKRKKHYAEYKERFKRANKKNAYYLFVAFLLAICVFQAVRGVYLNTAKYVVLNKQISKLEKLKITAEDRNEELRKQMKSYTTSKGIEALARDNLKMVGKDEVLVVVKQSPASTVNKKK